MKDDKLPEGLWPVMLSSFKENKAIDLQGIQNLTDFYLHTGANGLFANCLSSEMYDLTNEERISVIQTVVKATEGKIPVIATGTFDPDLQGTIAFMKKVYQTGVAAVVVNTNQLTGPDSTEIDFQEKLEKIMEATPEIPLGLYECPVPYKKLLSPSLMQQLADSGRFVYHKDTSCDISLIEHKLIAVQNSPLGFYNAHVPSGLLSMQKGAAGLSPIGANLYPELFSFLVRNYNDFNKAEEIKKVNDFLTNVDPLIHLNYPLSAKHFLKLRGLSVGETCRTSGAALSESDKKNLKNMLSDFEQLADEIQLPLALSAHNS